MAAMNAVEVLCPECGDPVKVTVTTRSEVGDGDTLVVTIVPDLDGMIEHFVAEHAADST